MIAVQAVLFDLGNTLTVSASLAESMEGIASSQLALELHLSSEQLHGLGLAVERCITSLYAGNRLQQPDWRGIWQEAARLSSIHLPQESVERLCRAHLAEYLRRCKVQSYSIPLLSGMFHDQIPLALVSNVTGPAEIFEADLSRKGLADFFQVVVWSSVAGVRKPAPEIFQIALDRLGIRAGKQVVMIGDHEQADILGGKQMGLTTVKVANGHHKQETSAADYIVDGLGILDLWKREFAPNP